MIRSAIDWRVALFVMMMGLPSARAADLPDPKSPGAALVMGYCTECHGVPLPSSHIGAEWAGVVARMQNWRITKGFGEIPKKDLDPLIDYLRRHGRPK